MSSTGGLGTTKGAILFVDIVLQGPKIKLPFPEPAANPTHKSA
jgi:hypothetical protein